MRLSKKSDSPRIAKRLWNRTDVLAGVFGVAWVFCFTYVPHVPRNLGDKIVWSEGLAIELLEVALFVGIALSKRAAFATCALACAAGLAIIVGTNVALVLDGAGTRLSPYILLHVAFLLSYTVYPLYRLRGIKSSTTGS